MTTDILNHINQASPPDLKRRADGVAPGNVSLTKGPKAYYPAFDYLRITLAISVAAVHAHLLGWPEAGNLAVQVFFSLSGWLIGGILMTSKSSDLPRFYFNRAARIWIPYAFAVILLIGASLLKDQVTPKWTEFVIYKLTFVYDLFGPPQIAAFGSFMPLHGTGNHFWSICAEEQFYLLAPLIILLVPFGRSPYFWGAIFVMAMATPLWNLFGAIAAGVLAAALKNRVGDWHVSKMPAAILLLASLVLFLGVYCGWLPYRIGAPAFGVAVVLVLARTGAHSRFAELAGGVSYPFYLNHWVGMFLSNAVFAGWRGSILSGFLGLILSLAFATVLYFGIDRFVRLRRNRFFNSCRGYTTAATAYILVGVGLLYGFWMYPGGLIPR